MNINDHKKNDNDHAKHFVVSFRNLLVYYFCHFKLSAINLIEFSFVLSFL